MASFYKHQSSKSEVREVHAITGVEPGGYRGALWRRRAEAWLWTVWFEDPLGCAGRQSPFLQRVLETWHCLQGQMSQWTPLSCSVH